MDYVSLSKTISYALRHAPWEFELEIDDMGWTDINQLLNSLKEMDKFKNVGINDIEKIIKESDKRRFERINDKIRALYGHTIQNKIKKVKKQPPDILYHGTARRFISSIKEQGLRPQGRQYVHLSIDKETALQVGKRRDSVPVILTICAKNAWNNGVRFYEGNEKVWLADFIESKYIVFSDPKSST